jgi:hypothetical protein
MKTETEKAIDAACLALNAFLPESIRPVLMERLCQVAGLAEWEGICAERMRVIREGKYNGWSNRETWLVPLWWNECPIESIEADTKQDAIQLLADQLEEMFHELNEVPLANLIGDLLNGAASRINWYEIAEHWIEDIEVTLTENTEEESA